MPYVPNDRIGIMGLYFPQSSATARILSDMRKAIFLEQKASLPFSDIEESQTEIAEMRKTIDGVTPHFSQHLNNKVFGTGTEGDGVRTVFLTIVDYLGHDGSVLRANVVIPRNLGTNPWSMYHGEEGYDSIDTRITAEQARQYISENEAALWGMGIESVFVKTSSFFYVRDKDLKEKGFISSEGAVDLDTLVTYLADTHGFVGLQELQKPTEKEYMERAVSFNAARQKQTVEQKVGRKLCQYPPFMHEGHAISDWGAVRIVPLTEEDAIYWGTLFGKHTEVGIFDIVPLHVSNLYQNPRPNGFKSYNIAVRARSKRRKPTIREIQVRDLLRHFNSEINEDSPFYHGSYRKTQTESSKRRQRLMQAFEYDVALKFMFNARELKFPVRSKK